MEAIILAGGKGTRLRGVVPNLPKPMAPVAGRPFLEILIASLAKKGITRAIISLGYMADVIRSHFGDSFCGVDIAYAEEEVPLGTGGGVRLAMHQALTDHVFVFNGDTFLDINLTAVEETWQVHKRSIIVGREVANSSRYNCLQMEGGQVVGFLEKGGSGVGLINAGCYVFRSGELDRFPLGKHFSIEDDYLAQAAHCTPFELYVSNDTFIDIGVPDDYKVAQAIMTKYL